MVGDGGGRPESMSAREDGCQAEQGEKPVSFEDIAQHSEGVGTSALQNLTRVALARPSCSMILAKNKKKSAPLVEYARFSTPSTRQ